MRVKVVKNKLAPPFTEAEFEICFGEGVNHVLEVVEMGERLGLVEKAGAWLSFGGERIGQGREQADRRLRGDEALRGAMEQAVREALDARRSVGALPAAPVAAA